MSIETYEDLFETAATDAAIAEAEAEYARDEESFTTQKKL